MAKEITTKDNPVTDALRKLKDDEAELLTKLKPLQEAIGALEKSIDKSAKKAKPASGAKDNGTDNLVAEEVAQESEEESQ
jgi:hypothetical protein